MRGKKERGEKPNHTVVSVGGLSSCGDIFEGRRVPPALSSTNEGALVLTRADTSLARAISRAVDPLSLS